MRLTWGPIRKQAIEAAREMGHTVSSFTSRRIHPAVRTGMCNTCYGWCWIAIKPSGEFVMGGRLLSYRCGTPEAQGFKARTPPTPAEGSAEESGQG